MHTGGAVAAVEITWAPWPWRAGFCITDDTDTAELATVRPVYDAMAAHGLTATKTVWAFPPAEPCGIPGLPASILRGVTLADPDYLDYCRELGRRGCEISLHGASAGNNRRETIVRAFELLDRHFPPAAVYICHAKNADNPYWQEKVVARGPLRALLARTVGPHRCSGEDPASPYFWGDICRERVRYIRLMRTTRINTLAVNPSMPYHEVEKPWVRHWFSATKRSFRDCTTDAALETLVRERGACVLYQYLCRYADPRGGVRPAFQAGLERLAGRRDVWVAPAGRVLDRLRAVQGVWLAARGREAWVANAGDEEVRDLQLVTAAAPAPPPPPGVHAVPGGVRIERLGPGEVVRIPFPVAVEPRGRRALRPDAHGHAGGDFGHGRVFVNTGAAPWRVAGCELAPGRCRATWAAGLEALRPTSRASDAELTALVAGQARIIVRELLFKGRRMDVGRWLAAEQIALEDHDRW